jgi:hypothetical protein
MPHDRLLFVFIAVAGTLALAGCETIGGGSGPMAAAPQPPMTRTRAAAECWMVTEKTEAGLNLDRRADIVDRCIQAKMKRAGR